jgi:hypothetical protein
MERGIGAAQGTRGGNAAVETIDDVIHELSEIIDYCWQQNSRMGYFPAMYRKVTARIKEGVAAGRFEDGQRLERLDVAFAQRYIDAFHRYRRGESPTRCWAYAFDMAQKEHPMIVQHLLLGMNAHINLDLGIAAADVGRGANLVVLEHDFFEVNDVLAGLLDEVQGGVDSSSPLCSWLDRLGGTADEAICNFSIRKARAAAWNRAQELHTLDAAKQGDKIDEYDRDVSLLARVVCPPTSLGNVLFQLISDAEEKEPRQVIESLI